VLAGEVDASITAVDLFPEFLDELRSRALNHGVADRITTLACSMDALPFSDGAFDVIWSEGAVYSMGFEAGVSYWRRFLKPEGVIAVSELTWLTVTRPRDLEEYWAKEYPEMDTASSKIEILERQGYRPEAYFVLSPHCWLENYYRPMRHRFADFLQRNDQSEQARAVVDAEKNEIALFEQYSAHYGYGFYVARKTGELRSFRS
jgi:SAM-dependent methyltransferase